MLSTDHYYNNYLKLSQNMSLPQALQTGLDKYTALFNSLDENKWGYRYAEGKWSIKELVQHVIDAERVFSYRAMCFARGEKQNLPPFEENEYAANSYADRRTGTSLAEEFKLVRQSTILLFNSFSPKTLSWEGTANNTELSVEQVGFVMAGHSLHHSPLNRTDVKILTYCAIGHPLLCMDRYVA